MLSSAKIYFLALFLSLGVIAIAHAEEDYTPLAPVPQLVNEATGKTDINTFIPGLIKLAIGVAGGLAVIRIIIGGIQYIGTDSFSGKSSARDTIQNALLGLLLAVGAYAILYTVNPELVNISFTIEKQKVGEKLDETIVTTATSAEGLGCTNNCIAIDPNELPIKIPGACSNTPCYISAALAAKLRSVATDLSGKVDWQITEAFPPTVAHIDPCHRPNNSQSGTCVDAALMESEPSALHIKMFLTSIENFVGTSYEYEVCNSTRRAALQNDPQLAHFRSKFKCETSTTAENVHINL